MRESNRSSNKKLEEVGTRERERDQEREMQQSKIVEKVGTREREK